MRVVWCTQKIDQADDVLGVYVEWMRRLAGEVERLTVIALYVGRHDLPANVRVISLGKERGVSRLGYVWNLYHALFFAAADADVLVSHMSTLWAILASPVCFVRRQPIALWYAHYLLSWHLRLAAAMSKIILTSVPESCAFKSPKVRAVGQGIDVDKFRPVKKEARGEFQILSLGRISPVKRLKELVAACALLKARGLKFHLDVYGEPARAGDGEYFDEVRRAATGLGSETVKFHGRVPHTATPAIYAGADLFVNLTRTGSFDKSILEAMSSRCVILVVNEAYRNILPSEAQFLLLADVRPETVAEGIRKISALAPAERERLGAMLRAVVVRDHNLETQMPRLARELQNICRKK